MNRPPLGRRLGVGRTAEVYQWGDDKALKLLLPGMSPESLVSEAQKTSAARAAGAPAPATHARVDVEGRFGVVFDRVGTTSMLEEILRSPWRARGWGKRLARIHAEVLRCRSTRLPDVEDVLAAKIESAGALPLAYCQVARDALLRLPDGHAVLHGDLHPDNVFATSSGPIPIDWTDAARGSPGADVVRTLWLLSPAAVPPDLPRRPLILQLAGVLRRSYLRTCRRLTGVARYELAGWRLPVAAARLSEGIAAEEGALLARVRRLIDDGPAQVGS